MQWPIKTWASDPWLLKAIAPFTLPPTTERGISAINARFFPRPGRGLQFLVELYTKLVNHRCLNQEAFTVKVDISSLAALAKEIDDVRLLSGLAAQGSFLQLLVSSFSSQMALSLREMPRLRSHREARPRSDRAAHC